ncbi:ribonuclease H-like domain-containing protein [Mycena amicta]|nr:ribonuclease H-like domain-containing protein [Mycena amicta]
MVLESDCPQGSELTAYYKAVKSKPLSSERAVISSCRASGLRRQEFATFIFDGNAKKLWKTGDNGKLPILQLLRDCETRWSAIHLMNVRFLLLFETLRSLLIIHQPISGFLKHPNQSSIAKHQLDDDQHQVLLDMQTILSVPHAGQELLSAERTPTFSIALPAYELILDSWLKLQNEIPELKHYIGVGIAKIQEYIKLGRKSRIYALAMIINPSMKLDWIEKHWPARDVRKAEEWILDAMTEFVTAERHQRAQTAATISIPSLQIPSSTSGMARLTSLVNLTRKLQDGPLPTPPATPTLTPVTTREPTAAQTEAAEQLALEDDRRVAKLELEVYKTESLWVTNGVLELVQYWDLHRRSKPFLYRVACDVLPVQATAVPSLQVLKFHFRQEGLDYTGELVVREEDYAIDGTLTPYVVRELLQTEKVKELKELAWNALEKEQRELNQW